MIRRPVLLAPRAQGDAVVLTLMASYDEESSDTTFQVVCPYCGEEQTIYLEPDVMGTLVQDCEVCCQPWQVHVTRDSEDRYVEVTRADGSE